ncbi:NUBPL iron-transfer p-loop NTPase domain-containing protein [Trichoderma breve]|uniref:NUBPL iron-transfer p-loop NTPase domain-containing protein n=1 Tax=Trichoderma breve TaxID=2034170 RepID=A0A9W9BGF7_9HYPO|nr:NUBPL iron-transfer p-loop NTPase domain-containing protein [Trichoderma breve]KAJ4861854.1 NUBPL iron-transfer p-loop NTPase domain-containing protein [Trichoderma breve]
MRSSPSLLFRAVRALQHENPLGLPRSGTPPSWPKRPQKRKIAGVDKVIAVSSAKGGVGKSTVAANLSLAFARLGYRAGILDTDIFGPSIPTLFDLSGEPRLSNNNQLVPLTNYGVKTMSMGYLVGESAPVVWRGPMVMKAIQQLLHEVDWGGLDILVLDLPPGTGDTQLTITQQIILDGSVIITTPHTLATKDAVKGINMFKTVGVNILGVVQNMSLFNCPHCHQDTHVFGSNKKVEKLCQEHGIDFLRDIPLHPNIGDDGERGKPTVVSEPSSERASAFLDIARAICPKIDLKEVGSHNH